MRRFSSRVVLRGCLEDLGNLKIPRLAHKGEHLCPGSQQVTHHRIVSSLDILTPGAAEND